MKDIPFDFNRLMLTLTLVTFHNIFKDFKSIQITNNLNISNLLIDIIFQSINDFIQINYY